jgi:hypothetical protein
MTKDYTAEVDAIKTVLTALGGLSNEAQSRVLKYAATTFGIQFDAESAEHQDSGRANEHSKQGAENAKSISHSFSHIKELKEAKKPRSANEMAALVAYFLANLVEVEQRKTSVTTKDLETYFKIASFPLPAQLKMTLNNAANAGYFDAIGGGAYKLNAVGHNLVVHSMPRGESGQAPKAKRKKNSAGRKKK